MADVLGSELGAYDGGTRLIGRCDHGYEMLAGGAAAPCGGGGPALVEACGGGIDCIGAGAACCCGGACCGAAGGPRYGMGAPAPGGRPPRDCGENAPSGGWACNGGAYPALGPLACWTIGGLPWAAPAPPPLPPAAAAASFCFFFDEKKLILPPRRTGLAFCGESSAKTDRSTNASSALSSSMGDGAWTCANELLCARPVVGPPPPPANRPLKGTTGEADVAELDDW